MSSTPPCTLCGGTSATLLFPGNIGEDIGSRFSQYAYYDDIFRCDSCGLVVQRRRHDLDVIAALLKAEKYLDEAIGTLNLIEKHVQFEALIRLIEKHRGLSGVRLLDVGANTGVFLKTVKDRVGTARGVEPSREAAAQARSQGLDVQAGLLANAVLDDQAFDVITLFDVIEHLTDPGADLATLFRKLAPGGAIFISTHDIGSLLARLSGPHYPMLMYQHFYHFTPRTLSALLEKTGFRVLGYDRFLKSWSVEYLYNLIAKKWPDSGLARRFEALLSPLLRVPAIRRARITSPQRDFFLLAAEKPR